MGGISEEREISLRTGGAVLEALKARGYDASAIDAGRDLPARLAGEGVEVAFIALHGRYGEDGCVQGVCEVMGLPYTGSGPLASALSMDKAAAKKIFKFHAIPTPRFAVVTGGGRPVSMPLPVVVKPAAGGSAIGVSIVREPASLDAAIAGALGRGPGGEKKGRGGAAIVEEYIEGRELTVAILDSTVYPVVEIRPHDGFYDYEAKYTRGMTDFVAPAEITEREAARVVEAAREAYRALGCRGPGRVDLILAADSTPYVLEVNTSPGLTGLSLFPRAALAAGVGYGELVEAILAGAGTDK